LVDQPFTHRSGSAPIVVVIFGFGAAKSFGAKDRAKKITALPVLAKIKAAAKLATAASPNPQRAKGRILLS
jgi:hypothetical protein